MVSYSNANERRSVRKREPSLFFPPLHDGNKILTWKLFCLFLRLHFVQRHFDEVTTSKTISDTHIPCKCKCNIMYSKWPTKKLWYIINKKKKISFWNASSSCNVHLVRRKGTTLFSIFILPLFYLLNEEV